MSINLPLCSLVFAACIDTSGSSGLVLDESSSVAARGRLDDIHFDLETDGATKTAILETLAGVPLIETTLRADDSRTTLVLGGKLAIETAPDGTSTYTGDRAAQAELDAMPEATAISALGDALRAADVDSAVLPIHVSHNRADSVIWVGNDCGSWNAPGVQSRCGTNFFGTTRLVMENCSSSSSLPVTFDGHYDSVPPSGYTYWFGHLMHYCGLADRTDYYWGRDVFFINNVDPARYGIVSIYYGH